VGYFRNFLNNSIEFSIEGYYKNLTNAADFEDGLHNYLVDNLEAYVATGNGIAYGMEASLEKKQGKFQGRLVYSLGKTEYLIDVINQGRPYPNMFDKTHDFTMMLSYELFKNLTVSSTFIYQTGRPVTLPESYYYVGGVAFPFWEGRNKYRLPDYHRLDFGIKYKPEFMAFGLGKSGRKVQTEIELSFYNVYNRRNVHTINFNSGISKDGSTSETMFSPTGVSTYGFMPSFQINFKF
jgi:hypothetical protein